MNIWVDGGFALSASYVFVRIVERDQKRSKQANDQQEGATKTVAADVDNVAIDEHATQSALADSQSMMRAILATVPDAMIVIDEQGLITSFSAAAENLFGYLENEIIGQNVCMLMPSPHREVHDAYIARYMRTGEKRIMGTGRVVEGLRRDGTLFPMELAIGEAQAEGHRAFTGFVKDLTERFAAEARMQELQAELTHASRLSAMGSLASALAHELNQPLTAVTNYVSAGRDMLGSITDETLPIIHEVLDEAAKEAVRAGQIVRRLRDFVSKGEVEREVISVAKLIGDATTLGLVGAREKGIAWSINVEDNIGDVIADRIQIQQVLVNLMRNAVEAMEISSLKQLTIDVHAISGDQVQIAVRDTGCGLDPDIAANLFQPFVSTKAKGMGLGLSICRTIIEAHGGQLEAEPSRGSGTVFWFTLNRANSGEA
jgi:two-component system, LuxR family, sensor kinase FixL